MGRCVIPGVCQKNGRTYRRFKVKVGGRWQDQYIRLPDPSDPGFAAALARVNGHRAPREAAASGTMAALCVEMRRLLARRDLAGATRASWLYYLDLIQAEHGKRLVADLRRGKCYQIRDRMADTPGKANNYMAKLKALLELACERDWIATNPAAGIPQLAVGEHDPWPAPVLAEVLAEADPMLRLAIVTGLCSGQRVSDVVRMQHGWHDRRIMRVTSKKTRTEAIVPMHPLWVAEIDHVEKKAVTLLYDRFGKPFTGPDRIQERLRRLMHRLGHVDADGQLLFTFHGLGKNACCYLTELGLDEATIASIVGKTPETVRHYAKQARRWMLAEAAAARVTGGQIASLVGRTTR